MSNFIIISDGLEQFYFRLSFFIGLNRIICWKHAQVVWHDTKALGCAAMKCEKLKGTPWKNALLVVCNYGPAFVETPFLIYIN